MDETAGLPTVEEFERVLLDSAARQADTVCIDSPDWIQLRTPSSPLPNLNTVFRARLAPKDVVAKIAEVLADHRNRGADFRWIVAPTSAPSNLGTQLQAAGLIHDGVGLGMARRVPKRANDAPTGSVDDAGLTHTLVTLDNVDAYASFAALAWQKDDDFARAIAQVTRLLLKIPADAPSRSQSWLTSLGGTPVAVSHLRFLPTVGYLQGAAVLPAYRGRGIYRALIQHRFAALARANLSTVVIWADTGGAASVCAELGFKEVTRATSYCWVAPPQSAAANLDGDNDGAIADASMKGES